MKVPEILSRLFIGFWFAICAIDGWAYLLFNYHMADLHGFIFVDNMLNAKYYWVFLKSIQTIVAISLLFNIRPALGLALSAPISSSLALFYFFELQMFAWAGVLLIIASFILFRKHQAVFMPLVNKPGKSKEESAKENRAKK